MSNPTDDFPQYGPTLIVGVGGTGVRTLRMLRWLATTSGDRGLTEAVTDGLLHMLAFDTDETSDRAAEVREEVAPRPPGWAGGRTTSRRVLPRLAGSLHLIPSSGIDNRLVELEQTIHERERQVAEGGLWSFFDWLPVRDQATLRMMTRGGGGGGAGQWRPLGRIALCDDAPSVVERLLEGLASVRAKRACGTAPNVHLVCSLAGGTGAGMFWDLAFLLRLLEPRCTITANFLLAESFQGVDIGGRVMGNAYAALKELSSYKNWTLPVGTGVAVRYQMGKYGRTFEASAGDQSVFDAVYLYRPPAPRGKVKGGDNIHEVLIDSGCLHIAENLAAQNRQDVRARLGIGGRNASTDVNAMGWEKERRNTFSSSKVARLELADPAWVALGLRAAIYRRLQNQTEGDPDGPLQKDVVVKRVHQSLRHWPQGAGTDAGPPHIGGGILGDWRRYLVSGPVFDRVRQEHDRLRKLKETLPAIREAAKKAAAERDPEARAEKARAAYALFDERLRTAWEKPLTDETREPAKGEIVTVFHRLDVFKDGLDVLWTELETVLRALERDIRETPRALDQEARDWIEQGLTALKAVQESKSQADRKAEVALPLPAPLCQMRVTLDLVPPSKRDELKRLHRFWGGGAIDQIFDRLCDRLAGPLDTASAELAKQDVWEEIVGDYLRKHADRIAAALRDLLRAGDEAAAALGVAGRTIAQHAFDALGDEYRAPDGLYEALDQTMAPLADTLSRLVESTAMNADAVQLEAERIDRHCEALAAHRHKRSEYVALAETHKRRERWARMLTELEAGLRSRTAAPAGPARTLAVRLADMIADEWLHSRKRGFFAHQHELVHALDQADVLAEGFVAYWLEQAQFLLARLGGEEGLKARLGRCPGTVFARGRGTRTIQLRRLVIGLPRVHAMQPRHAGADAETTLKSAFGDAAKEVLGLVPAFTEQPTTAPVIYFEETYRAGGEIEGVEDYAAQYRGVDERARPLLYIDVGGPALDDITHGPRRIRLCGNPGCEYDLTGVPYGTIHCPKCQGPILNRCGNPDCTADNLTALVQNPALGDYGEPDPAMCPVCKSGRLHTYWWRCSETAHAGRWLPSQENACPQCVEEYRAHRRPFTDIRRYNPEAPQECPGCLTGVADRSKHVHVSRELRRFLMDGVAPEPRQQRNFATLRRAANLPEDDCPQRDMPRHTLFPTLDFDRNGRHERHAMHRKDGAFHTQDGTAGTGYSCFHCGHPVDEAAVDRARAAPVPCPRCLRLLERCAYCTPRDGKLFAWDDAHQGQRRCPRCTNVMTRERTLYRPSADEGLTHPGFCPNIFGCAAGARPWSTAADPAHWTCQACADTEGSRAFHLLPYEDLRRHVQRCPVCLTLIGMEEKGRFSQYSPSRLLGHFAQMTDKVEAKAMEERCAICSTRPNAVLQWMIGTGYFASVLTASSTAASEVASLKAAWPTTDVLPQMPADNGIEILRAIMEIASDSDLYDFLVNPDVLNEEISPANLRRELARLFTGSSPCGDVVARRLDAFVAQYYGKRKRFEDSADEATF